MQSKYDFTDIYRPSGKHVLNVSGSVQERQEREKLILEIMRLAKKNSLQFYDGRVRQQR